MVHLLVPSPSILEYLSKLHFICYDDISPWESEGHCSPICRWVPLNKMVWEWRKPNYYMKIQRFKHWLQMKCILMGQQNAKMLWSLDWRCCVVATLSFIYVILPHVDDTELQTVNIHRDLTLPNRVDKMASDTSKCLNLQAIDKVSRLSVSLPKPNSESYELHQHSIYVHGIVQHFLK